MDTRFKIELGQCTVVWVEYYTNSFAIIDSKALKTNKHFTSFRDKDNF